MPSRAELVQRCPALVEGLAPADLDTLIAVLEERSLAADEVLLREGETSSCAYLVWSGSFRIVVGPENASVAAGELGPGSWLGEVSLVDGEPPSATAIASGPAVVLALPGAALERLRQENPRLAACLVRALCVTLAGRVRAATERLESLRGAPSQPAAEPRRGIMAALRALMGAGS
jgi:CRP-like cAMP-binding protein